MEKGETPPNPPLFYFFILKRLKIHIKWGVFVNSTVEPKRHILGNRAFLKCLVCFLMLLCTPVTAVCLTTAVWL